VLLYAWGLAVDYNDFKKYNINNNVLDFELLEYARSRFSLDQPQHKFILQYVFSLKEELKANMTQTIKRNMDSQLYNLVNGFIYVLDEYLRGFMPGGSKQSKLQQFIHQYKNKYFISEELTQQPYINNPFYIYKIKDISSSTDRTISVSRYRIDLKKNPNISFKNLKGQKETAKLSNNSILKIDTHKLIPL
jgi:hypothetical protein